MNNIVDREKIEDLQHNVAYKRKTYPQLCSSTLYKTLKIELNAVQSAVFQLDDSQHSDSSKFQKNSEECKQEMRNALKGTKSKDIKNKTDSVLRSLENISLILQCIVDSRSADMQMMKYINGELSPK